jgi:hypothetical protein
MDNISTTNNVAFTHGWSSSVSSLVSSSSFIEMTYSYLNSNSNTNIYKSALTLSLSFLDFYSAERKAILQRYLNAITQNLPLTSCNYFINWLKPENNVWFPLKLLNYLFESKERDKHKHKTSTHIHITIRHLWTRFF